MGAYGDFWLCGLGVLVALLLRSCTTLHPYSGRGNSPMFGDYEAQRHWQEVTVNLPVTEWYVNTTENDLLYWGLDYPPLTAYHSWICGKIAEYINPKFVELGASRGYESEEHKVFMRLTVLSADLLLYIPAICGYFFVRSGTARSVSIVLALIYPGVILIDHGHFQYNCISLGLFVIAVAFVTARKYASAAVAFSLALNYKQMELYHSTPFFVYLLSNCVPKPGQGFATSAVKLAKIGMAVIVTFALVWGPFLTDLSVTTAVVDRLFPLSRGVFEDKVSNFWCALNVVYKLKTHLAQAELMRYCLVTTLIAILPSSIDLFLRPTITKFVPSLIVSSLAFFLFSYQVHEKSILLVAVPVLLHLPDDPLPAFWFLTISNFSMLPLFLKDELALPFFALNLFFIMSFRIASDYAFPEPTPEPTHFLKELLQTLLDAQTTSESSSSLTVTVATLTYEHLKKNSSKLKAIFLQISVYLSLFGCFILYVISLFAEPPDEYPDLFPLLISVYCFVHFFGFFVYFNVVQFRAGSEVEKMKCD